MSHKTAATVAHTIGIDTGKNTLHLIGLDDQRAIVLREKIARGRIAARLADVPQCLIGIEAGMATHYVARELSALGQGMRQDPAPLPFLQEALTIAKFEPGVYEVVRTFTPAGETK
jgi:transposase